LTKSRAAADIAGDERRERGAAMITDWDDAYANAAYIEGGDDYPARWAAAAKSFRDLASADGRADLDLAYGEGARERLDLFRPPGRPRGVAIFAHGGYWLAFDKSSWSHLAQGALARDWAVCVPSYPLAPEARVSTITRRFAQAVAFAAERLEGPIRLAGHSAGGHLVTRMTCAQTPLAKSFQRRIARALSISGLHDLRPLLQTRMNATLRLDEDEAVSESAALLRPMARCSLVTWVGGDERPEFIRQSKLLADIWTGLGAEARCEIAPGRHHFNVVDDLTDPASRLVEAWLGGD
jgi:arylformamidase